jgi:uncharacterized repeat protein (TIGR03803 family)
MKHLLLLALSAAFGLSGTITAQNMPAQLFAFSCKGAFQQSCANGGEPFMLIQASDGNFYGTTLVSQAGISNPQGGSIYKITPAGQFTLLFTFSPGAGNNYPDGDLPGAALVEGMDGMLYGTAIFGGGNNAGVIFKIGKDGSGFQVVHNFCSQANCADGSTPVGLIQTKDGNFYGSVSSGGAHGFGAIFKMMPSGAFSLLHSLDGVNDAYEPSAIIQASDGNFYGTDHGTDFNGQVFKVTPSGRFTVIHVFPFDDFAISPLLQASNGNLFGVSATYTGGQQLYELAPTGGGFQSFPAFAPLIGVGNVPALIEASDGNLWETTFEGGEFGAGSIRTLSRQGAVTRTFSFNGLDGGFPDSRLLQGADGKIYGTATGGGMVGKGLTADGTVFSLDAGLAPPEAAITAFKPGAGMVGAKVAIRGNHMIGTTAVSFNGVSASFTVLNVNFIVATVPAGASTGSIAVTNAGGTVVSAKQFVVR